LFFKTGASITELRKKSQITIPKDMIIKLGLKDGDKLEIIEKDGSIWIMPVVVYHKKYLDSLREEVNLVNEKIVKGEQQIFSSAKELLKDLDTHKV
jgi:AbrB family looped-hinge helix DNA binding protein